MHGRALDRGNHESRGPGPGRLGKFNFVGCAESVGGGVEDGQGLRLKDLAKVTSRDRDPKPVSAVWWVAGYRVRHVFPADRVARIRPAHRVICQGEIGGGTGQRAGMVQTGGEGEYPGAGQSAIGRLETMNAANRGRHPDRAVGIGAQRQW